MPNEGPVDEEKPAPVVIKLAPRQLLFATQDAYAREIPGAELETDLRRGVIVFREFTPPLELRALDYWLHFGEWIRVDREGQSFLIEVPDIYEVLLSLNEVQDELKGQHRERMRSFINRAMPEFATEPGAIVRLPQLPERFFAIPFAERTEGIRLFRQYYAGRMLTNSLAQPTLDAYAQARPFMVRGREKEKFWEEQRNGAALTIERFREDQEQWQSIFQRWYHWENNVLPPAGDPGIIQFLPPPPRREREDDEERPAVDRDHVEINVGAEDLEVVPLEQAGQRLAIYRKFGCKRVVRPKRLFGREEHNYFGYLIRTLQGTWLMVIDCDVFGCAAYLSQINPNDPFRYIIDVQLPKLELRRILAERGEEAPGPEDEAPTYIGREVHDATFEARMRRRYEED